MNIRTCMLIAAMGLLLVACGTDVSDGESPEEITTSTTESDNGQQDEPDPTDTTAPDSSDTTRPDSGDPNAEPVPDEPDPVVGEVPDEIMQDILADASDRTGIDIDELEVERAQAETWSDGALGCPQPGEVYTQALVDGYWVEIIAGEETLDYRVDGSGFFKLCEGQQTPHSDPEGDAGGIGYGSGEEIGPPSGSPES